MRTHVPAPVNWVEFTTPCQYSGGCLLACLLLAGSLAPVSLALVIEAGRVSSVGNWCGWVALLILSAAPSSPAHGSTIL